MFTRRVKITSLLLLGFIVAQSIWLTLTEEATLDEDDVVDNIFDLMMGVGTGFSKDSLLTRMHYRTSQKKHDDDGKKLGGQQVSTSNSRVPRREVPRVNAEETNSDDDHQEQKFINYAKVAQGEISDKMELADQGRGDRP